jgi:adenylate kinase
MHLLHISSETSFAEHCQTELGNGLQFHEVGELVPDDVTIQMIMNAGQARLRRWGTRMVPRTPAQAIALDEMRKTIDGRVVMVPYIMVPEGTLLERLTGRWTCRANGHIFHEKFNPPQHAGRCDIDGSELYQRDDDKAETVSRRIRVYMDQTAPLITYYRECCLLQEIDGSQTIDNVTKSLLSVLPEK